MLLCNQSPLMQCPVRFMAGSTTSVEPQLRRNWNQNGRNRNKMYRDQTTAAYKLWANPNGYYPPYTWQIAQKGGYISSHDNTILGIATNTPNLYGGITTTAPASFDISMPNADGQLIATVAAGDAPATFGLVTNSPLLTAVLPGDGTATFGIDTNNPILGALGGMTINVTFSIDAGPSSMLPTDDTPPARTATADFSVSGTLLGHAIGIMEGTTAEQGVTVDNVVAGVWNALLADYQTSGSAGYVLSLAGTGGVDYDALANAVWTRVTRTITENPGISVADIVAGLEATTIPVDIAKVNGITVDGAGTDVDPWGPV